jgi:hypothetical protein
MPILPKTDNKSQFKTSNSYSEQIQSYENKVPIGLFKKIKEADIPDIIKIRLLSRLNQDILVNIPLTIDSIAENFKIISDPKSKPSVVKDLKEQYIKLGVIFSE